VEFVGDELGLKDAQHPYIRGRVQVNETPQQAYFEVAKRWLVECEIKHSKCDNDIPILPTRVVCVAEDGHEPYLANGGGKHARYATLSHCWGASTSAMTTSKTLREHQNAIPLDGLPKTFRDAVVICRHLGILYLWIDRLCIVQDSKSDWERESGAMGSIFQDSTLTLAATVSRDSSQGLFIPPRHDVFPLPPSFGDYKGQAYLIDSTPKKNSLLQVENSILQTRGWVMQEMHLARRLLYFVHGEMAWSCCEKTLEQKGNGHRDCVLGDKGSLRKQLKTFAKAFERSWVLADSLHTEVKSEHGHESDEEEVVTVDKNECPSISTSATTLPYSTDNLSFDIVDLRDPLYRTSSPPITVSEEIDFDLYQCLDDTRCYTRYHIWYLSVEAYCRRKLTFASDKLPAMAGIAARIQAITHDHYLAGHWRQELERSLFWSLGYSEALCSRVKEYRAPSWSWASMDGPLIWGFPDLSRDREVSTVVEILEATTVVEGDNTFGCVSSARLVIKASILAATWNADYRSWVLSGTHSDSDGNLPQKLNFLGANGVLNLLDVNGVLIGKWGYDDDGNGLLPGSPLSPSSSEAEIEARRAPQRNPRSHNYEIHDEDLSNTPMWERGTYVPEELVLVKGPKKTFVMFLSPLETYIQILVLARTVDHTEEYRRVGTGLLRSWDESVQREDVLTLV
jgi:hypothetical protein